MLRPYLLPIVSITVTAFILTTAEAADAIICARHANAQRSMADARSPVEEKLVTEADCENVGRPWANAKVYYQFEAGLDDAQRKTFKTACRLVLRNRSNFH